MRLTWQNLTDGKRNIWVYGRAWLWGNGDRGQVARFEWHHSLRPSSLACEITTGAGDSQGEFMLRLSLVFASYYLTLDGFIRRWQTHERTTGISLHGDRLAVQWRCDGSSWSRKNGPAAGKEWHIYLLDTLLGRPQYREGEPETHRITIPMPEGVYHGTCVMRRDSWKRPLWFRHTVRRAHIDMDDGQQVPVPGKGENSWDQGEDGIYGMTCPAETVDEAIAKVVESTERQRHRHGGRGWRPSHVA